MLNIPPFPQIIDSYGLKGPLTLSPMGSHWRIDQNYRPLYLFKRFSSDREYTQTVWRRLNFLDRQGLTPSPLWYPLLNGEPALEWRGHYWILIPWLNGSPAPVFTDWGFQKLLRLLSFVHQLGHGYREVKTFNPAQVYAQRLSEMQNGFSARRPSEFDDAYQKMLGATLANTERACGILKEVAGEPLNEWTLCHGDPSVRNTFQLGDGRWAFVDWDRIIPAPRWWELSQALRRFNERNGWKNRSVWAVLRRGVRPSLSRREQLSLWCCLLFPQSLWRLGAQYYQERLNRPERWFMDRLEAVKRQEIHRLLALQDWGRFLES